MSAKKLFCWGKMLAAFVFLFNPNANLIDIFPDVIGYLLLMLSIRDAAELFPHFDEAYNGFTKLFWINAAKIPALFIMLTILGVNNGERTILTVMAFAFAALELFFAIPAFRAFWDGFIHLGEREGLLPALKAGKSKKGIDGVIRITWIFLFVKAGLSFLPELSLLSVMDTLSASGYEAFSMVRFYPILLVFALFVGFIFGGVWLFHITSYVIALNKSGVMTDFLAERAETVSDRLSDAARARMSKISLYLIGASLLFGFDLILDSTNFLPDAFSGALLFFAFLALRKESRFGKWGIPAALLYTVSTAVRYVWESAYFKEYTYTDVAYRTEAAAEYLWIEIFAVAEAFTLIASIFLLFFVLRDHVNGGIRLSVGNTANMDSGIRKELVRKLKYFTAAGIVSAVYHAAEVFALTLTERHVVTAAEANPHYAEGHVLYYPLFGGSWLLGTALTAVWVVLGFYFIYSVREETAANTESF